MQNRIRHLSLLTLSLLMLQSTLRAVDNHPLLNKPAPDFNLKDLAGSPIDVASHKGKEVVVLDFWDIGCGPCVQWLPKLAEIRRQYQDKGVVFYTIDIRDDADAIATYLKAQQIEIPTGVDVGRKVKALYRATSIPETVIIDKEGIVRCVHIGYGPTTPDVFVQKLEAILGAQTAAK
jgi:thiol-disulfide isomerase/thioredoxin